MAINRSLHAFHLLPGFLAFLLLAGPASAAPFLRGDANQDFKIDIADPIYMLNCMFSFIPDLPCMERCQDSFDVNDDGRMDISDPIAELTYIFLGGNTIPPPFPACGEDPSEDLLTCLEHIVCPSPPPEGRLVKASDCKGSGGGSGGASSNEECLEWSFAGSVLTLRHVNAGFNCCAEFTVDTVVEGGTIAIAEDEGQAFCDCNCLFDLDLEVSNLVAGPYLLRVSGSYGGVLEVSLDLVKEPAGSHCEKRSGYPWGVP